MTGKNLRKKIFTAVMTAALAVVSALAPLQGAAAAEESGAITVHFAPGTTFTVYKVADYAETGEFTLTDAFKGAQVENLEKIEKGTIWDMSGASVGGRKAGTLAEDLKKQIQAGSIKAAPAGTGKTAESGAKGAYSIVGSDKDIDDYKGAVKIGGLGRGLYLLVGDPIVVQDTETKDGVKTTTEKTYTPYSTLFAMPSFDSENTAWAYDLDYFAKGEMTELTENEVNYSVRKVWNGDNAGVRPSSVQIRILLNGNTFDTVTLNSSNNWTRSWSYKWNGNPSQPVRFEVTEINIPQNYEMSVTRSGATFVVTNTYTPPTPPPPTPPTPTPPTPTPPGGQVLGAQRRLDIAQGVLGATRGVLGATRTGDSTSSLPLIVFAGSGAALIGFGLYMILKKRESADPQ